MIIEWWNALSLASQVFFCIAIPSTLVLLIQTILLMLGIGDDGSDFDIDAPDIPDGDMDMDTPDGVFGDGDTDLPDDPDISGFDGLRIFTLRGIIAFFVVFGWTGVAMSSSDAPLWLTILIATLAGFVMMLFLAVLLRLTMKLKNNGNIDNRNAIGTAGKVYLTVPAARRGEGKVQIMLQGSYVERNAVTDDEEPIPTGSEIVVVGLSGQTDLVVRKK